MFLPRVPWGPASRDWGHMSEVGSILQDSNRARCQSKKDCLSIASTTWRHASTTLTSSVPPSSLVGHCWPCLCAFGKHVLLLTSSPSLFSQHLHNHRFRRPHKKSKLLFVVVVASKGQRGCLKAPKSSGSSLVNEEHAQKN